MMTQRTLVKDMIPWVAPLVGDSGVCATTEDGKQQCIEALDLACDILIKRLDSEGTLFEWYAPVTQGCFALPQDCREARQIDINGYPLRQRDQWYQGKVAGGSCGRGCSPMECIDQGDFYIPVPLPGNAGMRISLVAEHDGDAGVECIIEVLNGYGERVKETLTLLPDQQPVTTASDARDVTFFKKPKTKGAVSMQLDTGSGQRLYISSIHPSTQESLWRRKLLPRQFWGCNVARILGKIRYVSLTDEEEIMPFNDRIAMGFAVKAVAAWRRNDIENYTQSLAGAVFEIMKQMQDADSASNVRQVIFRTNFANSSQAGGRRLWT